MQSQSFWKGVTIVTDMFETEPVEGSFEEWMGDIWKPFEAMCLQMAQHHYVMQMAHRQWRQEETFIDDVERERLKELCMQVQLDPREIVEEALKRHKRKCLNQ